MSGEIVEAGTEIATDASTLERLQRADVSTQVETARRFPRPPLKKVASRMVEIATMDEVSAEEMIYSLPRKDKVIEGPSARFAEALAQVWGNCRIAARIVDVNTREGYVEAEGIFVDVETNAVTARSVRRRIKDSRGRIYNADMIQQTGNAAASIACRNAVLAGIPKAVQRPAYDAARNLLMGDVKTLANRRSEALRHFQRFGVTAEQVLARLGLESEDQITQDHLVTLRSMYGTLRNGEETPESMFRDAPAETHQAVEDPLSDEPVKATDDAAADKPKKSGGKK